ncbi:MAG: porphobilinogen synthase [Pseudomonadota bacterium]
MSTSPARPTAAPAHPFIRPRRTRAAAWRRDLVRETRLSPADLIWPIFLIEGENRETQVDAMPGVSRLTIDRALPKVAEAAKLGVPCVALFPSLETSAKTKDCREAWNEDNLVCRAARTIKREIPEIGVMQDVALDPYNADGHDGLVIDGRVDNDASLEALIKQALAQAAAGSDILGPSDMMDGRIGAIRGALEAAGHRDVLILSYAAKYASGFYGPFREAVGADQSLGKADGPEDKKTYQMDPANADEALREIALDLNEGADMIMVKPGMPYLDICRRAKDAFAVPTYAYQVSGEFAMIEAAAARGWLDRRAAILESLTAFKRAGCDGVLTYFAPEVARWLQTDR